MVGATETEAFLKGSSPEHRSASVGRIVSSLSVGDRLATPEDIARTLGLIVSKEAGWITGSIIAATGGAVKLV
jgi:NAD(P)-dependent dehydrogenase (short-subunit alcohol dehydrogenase family)